MSKLIDFDILSTSNGIKVEENLTKSWHTINWSEYGWIVVKLVEPADGTNLIIDRIEFDNNRSAFVEIFISNQPEPESQFRVLKQVFSTLSPNFSRDLLMTGQHTKHFQVKAKDFSIQNFEQHSAKFIKFVCSQPFNKSINFGLGNIQVYAHPAGINLDSLDKDPLENEKPSLPANTYQSDWKQHKTENSEAEANARKIKLEKLVKLDNKKTELKSISTPTSSTKKNRLEEMKIFSTPSSSAKKRQQKHPPSTSKTKRPMLFPEDENNSSHVLLNKKPKPETSQPKIAPDKNKSKPFNELLKGVTFAMSGYVNPLRAQIRERGLAMGAKYMSDWDSARCTHLVCAFKNTPKFDQAQRDHARIVSHQWIEDCYITKKYINWRNFMLGTYSGPSSPQAQDEDSDAIYDMETDEDEDN